jgi:endonuclease YncB( thermonuclease family)
MLLTMFVAARSAFAGSLLPVCSGGDRVARHVTCIVDGDTGWEHGVKWRSLDVDTPEIDHAACERERRLGETARDRLRALMAGGYAIEWQHRKGNFGRELAMVRLADGRIAGQVLMKEGLSQPWPNHGNRWCE